MGWERSQRFTGPYCARQLVKAGLTGAGHDRLSPAGQAEPLTHLICGAVNQAGIVTAGRYPATERARLGQAITGLVRSRPRNAAFDRGSGPAYQTGLTLRAAVSTAWLLQARASTAAACGLWPGPSLLHRRSWR